jgi:hypothetical protein
MANLTTKKNAFYAQSGGVTAVINASACGVIEATKTKLERSMPGKMALLEHCKKTLSIPVKS